MRCSRLQRRSKMIVQPEPAAPTDAVRRRMSAQPRRDTQPEIALRRELHGLGYRFRVNYPVPGRSRRTIDVAFTKRKLAVFVDGCFWHACPEHSVPAKNNAVWWQRKLAGNVKRDRDTDDLLEKAGWSVVRVWEHESSAEAAADVVAALNENGDGND